MFKNFALCGLAFCGLADYALAYDEMPTSRVRWEESSTPVSYVPTIKASQVIELGPASQEELLAFANANYAAQKGSIEKPLQIGFGREIPAGQAKFSLAELPWQWAGDKHFVTAIEVTSKGASALRAALSVDSTQPAFYKRSKSVFGLNSVDRDTGPDLAAPLDYTAQGKGLNGGFEIRTFNADGKESFSTAINADADDITWLPIVNGDRVNLELHWYGDTIPYDLSLSIPRVSHLMVHPAASDQEINSKVAGSCNLDIACHANDSTPAFLETAKAVARMTITDSRGASGLCTGTLLNNRNTPRRNLFYTAAHCVSTAGEAASVVTWWFYENVNCHSGVLRNGRQTLTGGARLLYAHTTRDVALLELNSAPPMGATYAGWTEDTDFLDDGIYGIHHPDGDVKKFVLGTIVQRNVTFSGRRPLYRMAWAWGTTEGGSSGSGIFAHKIDRLDHDYQLVGGLYGGTASCTMQTAPDYYSMFSDVYPLIRSYFGE